MPNIDIHFNPPLWNAIFIIRRGILKKVEQYAPELTGDLLDFGCGSKPYKPLFSHVKSYVGIDIVESGHNHDKEEIDLFYDGKSLPFKNEQFDSVLSTEVFEHVFNLPLLLEELHRVLKPKGRMLFTCPFVWPEHEIPYDYARYTLFALESELGKKGFKILIKDKSGNFYSTLIQMRILLITEKLIPQLRIKLLVSILRRSTILVLNTYFVILKCVVKVLPIKIDKSLYLNNIVLVEKIC